MLVYFNGLLLGLSLIMALGPQNVFLIRQGALKNHAVLSAVICFCCDIILIVASVAGLHHILTRHPSLQTWITVFGVLFLLYYGYNALQNGIKTREDSDKNTRQSATRLQIIFLALGFSLLNPHAIIDSLVIIGGSSSQFPDHRYAFMLGVITSSFVWFTLLTLTARYFADTLSRQAVWQRVELCSGALMIFLSLKLAANLL
ncbi:LysE/ArgO family amino acid transporter [Legionella dresdenensis]|uniref:LysE/ArgO family amino acid transporter n=1 Tax=Legionella dresdenensis TaxID=450200 RepID=A0ABV8CHV8_9GAMM